MIKNKQTKMAKYCKRRKGTMVLGCWSRDEFRSNFEYSDYLLFSLSFCLSVFLYLSVFSTELRYTIECGVDAFIWSPYSWRNSNRAWRCWCDKVTSLICKEKKSKYCISHKMPNFPTRHSRSCGKLTPI